MGYKETQKAAAKAKRLRAIRKKLQLIGFGAGVVWQKDGYFEMQDSPGKCLSMYIAGVRQAFSLPQDSFIFSAGNLPDWDDLNVLCRLIENGIESEKAKAKDNS